MQELLLRGPGHHPVPLVQLKQSERHNVSHPPSVSGIELR